MAERSADVVQKMTEKLMASDRLRAEESMRGQRDQGQLMMSTLTSVFSQQQQAARAAASKEAGSKLAAAIENLSHDKDLIALFKELEDLQKSEEKGTSAKISKKSKEITAYIKDKRKDMSFGSGDEQDVRRGVSKRLKKGDDDKGDKLDEARWAKLAGILKG